MTEGLGVSPPSKPSLKTFIKQFTQRPSNSKEDELLSTHSPDPSNLPSSPNNQERPKLQHKSRSSSAIITIDKNKSSAPHHNHHHNLSHHHTNSALSTSPPPSSNFGSSYINNDLDSNGIFGVPLEDSVKYASATINIRDKNNKSAVGKIPILVANCAKFLKRDATKTEGIFRVSGSARRIKELQTILTDPKQNFGKDLDWSPYTVHDSANILRRYLNHLPEPIIPLRFYEKFRSPLFKYPSVIEHLQGGNAISATTPPSSAAISPLIKTAEDAITGVSAIPIPLIPSVVSPLENVKSPQLTHTDLPTVKENTEEPILEKSLSSPSQETNENSDSSKSEEPLVETTAVAELETPLKTTATSPSNPDVITTKDDSVNTKEEVNSSIKSAEELTLKHETKLAIKDYCELIDQLPILNQQLLLYILDLLYTFSKESEYNLMPAVNLASIFQPSILSHPNHNMAPQQYHLSRAVTQFLIENFLQLTISVRTWTNPNPVMITTSSDSLNNSLGPGKKSSEAPVPQRRHSKSMSSVMIPSNIKDLIKDPSDPLNSTSRIKPNLYPNSVNNYQQDGQFFKAPFSSSSTSLRKSSIPETDGPIAATSTVNGKNSPALSPMISPSEKPIAGFFQALKRGASLSRRRTSSTSTASSSVLGLDHSNSSASSLPRQTLYIQNQRTSSIPNSIHQLSEADETRATPTTTGSAATPVSTSDDVQPPQKSPSSVTITPTRRASNNVVEGFKVPTITTMSTTDKGSTVNNPCILSETESENETSQSEVTDKQSKKHRRTISSLLSRRSGSPALHLGHSSAFKKIDNHRMYNSLSELPLSIDSALASPSIRSEKAFSPSDNSLGTSPKNTKSLAFFAGGLSNDSSSSIGVESDEDGFSYTGSKNSPASQGTSSSTKKKTNSRWRRSLMKFNIPVQSPDSNEDTISNPLHAYDPKHSASLDHMLSPMMSPPEPPRSPGARLMRKFNRRKRDSKDSKALQDESATSAAAADTSDSGFSN